MGSKLVMNRRSLTHSGFNAVELFLSLGLVFILVGVVVWAVNPIERFRQRRDERRFTDFDRVKEAIDAALWDEVPLANTFGVPSSTVGIEVMTKVDGSGWVSMDLSNWVKDLPEDPLNEKTFTDVLESAVLGEYQFISDGAYYILRTHLEAEINKGKYTEDGNDNSWYEVGTAPGLSTYFGL